VEDHVILVHKTHAQLMDNASMLAAVLNAYAIQDLLGLFATSL